MGTSSAVHSAQAASVWLYPAAIAAILGIIVVITQFIKNGKINYFLVPFIIYFGITRVLVAWHVMTLTVSWHPSSTVIIAWILYYVLYVGFIVGYGLRVWALWKQDNWLNRCLQVFLGIFISYHSFFTVFGPYATILKR